MSKGAYIGVNNVARKIKGGYVGVGGVARRIKRAYIGVGGVARPCWGGELTYYGTATLHYTSKSNYAATTVGNYGIFAGGNTSGAYLSVDAVDTSLTVTTPSTSVGTKRYALAATTIGNYALFGGGQNSSASYLASVDAFDASCTYVSTVPDMSSNRFVHDATTVGNYGIFGMGKYGSSSYSSTFDAYNSSLTLTTGSFGVGVGAPDVGAASNGSYAVFMPGNNKSNICFVNGSLTASTATVSATVRRFPSGARAGNYALISGLAEGGGTGAIVYAYNQSLTLTVAPSLSGAKYGHCGVSHGEYAIFAGGSSTTSVDSYDASLTLKQLDALQAARSSATSGRQFAGTSVGSYCLIGGVSSKTGDVYTL